MTTSPEDSAPALEVNSADYYMSEPKRQIACTFDKPESYHAAVAALIGTGIDASEMRALHGTDGAEILDLLGENHGLIANIRRIFPTINNAVMGNMSAADTVLRAGGHALIAPAEHHDDARVIANLLLASDAKNVFYFGKDKMWTFS